MPGSTPLLSLDMDPHTLESLCTEPTVQWHVQVYIPLLSEFPGDDACRRAQVANSHDHYRVSKLVKDSASLRGHYIVTRSYKVPSARHLSAQTPCPICSERITRGGLLVGSVAFHKKCIPGFVSPGTAEMLVLFGEEIEQVRPPEPKTASRISTV